MDEENEKDLRGTVARIRASPRNLSAFNAEERAETENGRKPPSSSTLSLSTSICSGSLQPSPVDIARNSQKPHIPAALEPTQCPAQPGDPGEPISHH